MVRALYKTPFNGAPLNVRTHPSPQAVAKLHAAGGRGIIGGGDSATAAANAGMEDKARSGLGQGAMPTAQLPITTVVTPLSADGVTIGSHMTWAS